ncbi:hypothetical protein HanIR_Chr02g0098711 [Helianthus annuus]|nr:hypothetical protein HanIR_Chr02g0098711 [Helianthus annuus]
MQTCRVKIAMSSVELGTGIFWYRYRNQNSLNMGTGIGTENVRYGTSIVPVFVCKIR